jgi:hypothetical protein
MSGSTLLIAPHVGHFVVILLLPNSGTKGGSGLLQPAHRSVVMVVSLYRKSFDNTLAPIRTLVLTRLPKVGAGGRGGRSLAIRKGERQRSI